MSPRRIGILGGMGPEATLLLMRKLIDAVPAAGDADHIPLIVDMNTQVPSRIRRLIDGTGDDPGPVLAAMARRLAIAGAEALAMPCNTAHHYAAEIRAAAEVPFIDMIALSVARAARLVDPARRVGILASPAVRRIGLFDRALAAAGLVAVHPDDGARLLAAIRAIKADGPSDAARRSLGAASADLLSQGAAFQLIACTEFSLLPDAVAPGAVVLDTMDALVDGIVAFACNGASGHGKAA